MVAHQQNSAFTRFGTSPASPRAAAELTPTRKTVSGAQVGYRTESSNATNWEGPTKLFELIEARNWDASIARLNDEPSEACQWVLRKYDKELTMRRLPIHEACNQNPSVGMILALLEVHRDGVGKEDLSGRLPLHCACIHGASLDVVLELLYVHPEALDARDKWGRTPLDCLLSRVDPDEELIAALEKRPTYYAVQVAAMERDVIEALKRDELKEQLKEEYNEMVQDAHETAKKREIKLGNYILGLKEEMEKMEQNLRASLAREQSLVEEKELLIAANENLANEATECKQKLTEAKQNVEKEQSEKKDLEEKLVSSAQDVQSFKDVAFSMQDEMQTKITLLESQLEQSIKANEATKETNEAHEKTISNLTKELNDEKEEKNSLKRELDSLFDEL